MNLKELTKSKLESIKTKLNEYFRPERELIKSSIVTLKEWCKFQARHTKTSLNEYFRPERELLKSDLADLNESYIREKEIAENNFIRYGQWYNARPAFYRDLAVVLILVALFSSFVFVDNPAVMGKITSFREDVKSHLSFAKSNQTVDSTPAATPAAVSAPTPVAATPAPAATTTAVVSTPVATTNASATKTPVPVPKPVPAPKPAASATPPTLTSTQVQKITQTILASTFSKDVPEKYPISLTFFTYWNGQRITLNSFLIGKGQILSSGTPGIKLTLHSKYVDSINGNNLCDIVKTANKNGDLGFESSYSTASLLLKYSGMLKHRACFGF